MVEQLRQSRAYFDCVCLTDNEIRFNEYPVGIDFRFRLEAQDPNHMYMYILAVFPSQIN